MTFLSSNGQNEPEDNNNNQNIDHHDDNQDNPQIQIEQPSPMTVNNNISPCNNSNTSNSNNDDNDNDEHNEDNDVSSNQCDNTPAVAIPSTPSPPSSSSSLSPSMSEQQHQNNNNNNNNQLSTVNSGSHSSGGSRRNSTSSNMSNSGSDNENESERTLSHSSKSFRSRQKQQQLQQQQQQQQRYPNKKAIWTIVQQYQALTGKKRKRRKNNRYHGNDSDNENGDESDDGDETLIEALDKFALRRAFSPKEKLIILHLAHLTCREEEVKLSVFEDDIRSNVVLRACLYGRSVSLIQQAVDQFPDQAKSTLHNSQLNIVHMLVSSGNSQALGTMMDKYEFIKGMIDRPANNNLTPLHVACLFGLDSIVRLLLNHRVHIETECQALPFFMRRRAVHEWHQLKESTDDVPLSRSLSSSHLLPKSSMGNMSPSPVSSPVSFPSSSTPITSAAGFLHVLHYWKDHVWSNRNSSPNRFFNVGSHVLNICNHFMNPLLFAVMGGSVTTIRTIMDYKPKIEMQPPSQNYRLMCEPLTLSCVMGYDHVTQHLLSVSKDWTEPLNFDLADINGVTPLILNSMAYGSGAVSEVLVRAGANMSQVDSTTGNTALHYAIVNSHVDVLRAFVCQTGKTEDVAVLVNAANHKQTLTPLQLVQERYRVGLMNSLNYSLFSELLIANGAQSKKVYSEIVKEGWLFKEGHIYKTHRGRYFILSKSGVLRYYKDIRKLKNPSGEIVLSNGVVQKETKKKGMVSHPYVFSVLDTVNNKKTYMFCEVEEVRDAWIEAISYCISIARKD